MQKKSIILVGVLAVLAMAFAGCIQPLTPSTDTGQDAGVTESSGEETTLFVGPTQADCVGEGPMICMMVKTEPDGEYQLFYNQIEGFEYVPGYEYELLVTVEDVANPPAGGSSLEYTLVEEVSATEVGPTLEGTPWQMVALADENGESIKTLPEVEVTALFENGKVGGSDGCNRYSGSYTLDGANLTIDPALMGTMMACPDPIMKQATAYTAALISSASYAIVDNQLRIMNDNGRTVVTYDVRVPTSLTGTTWDAIGYNNGKEAVVSITIGTEITAVFGEDGTLSGSAGCNNYTAGYEADDVNIDIGPAATTRKMCGEPEGIMEQESLYLAALEMAEVYTIDGDRLQLRTSEGSLVADYRAATDVAAEGSDSDAASTETESTVAGSSSDEETTLYVGPTQSDCVGAGPMICMLVKTDADEDYGLFYSQIEGFEYVPGYEYELLVNVEDVPNPPADGSSLKYTLIEEVSATEVGPTLEGTPWQMVALADENGEPVRRLPKVEVTALFEDGGVSGTDGCNSYSGSYSVDGTALTVGPEMMGTAMACPDPIMKQAGAYTAALTSAASYAIVDNQLRIMNDFGRVVVTYEERVSTALTGTTWNVIGYNNGKGGVVSIAIETEITATFGEDGTLSGSAGCNNYTAGYEADDVNIEIGPAAVNMMMCAEPEGIMEQESLYLAALEMAEVYSIDGDRLQLRTGEGSLVADYRAAVADAAEDAAGSESGTDKAAGTQPAAEAAPEGAEELTESLANMEYKSEFTASGTAPLEDGKYSEEAAPGSASKIEVTLTDKGAVGELNGEPAAAVVLVTNPGGSGTFYDLAIVMEEDGSPVNVATTSLGDRVQVNSVAIEDNQIVVDMVQSGPDDPMCCPTQHVINTYVLEGDELVETSSTPVDDGDTSTSGASAGASTPVDAEDLTESLANMEYKSEYTADGTAPLEDGKYSEEAAPGSATKTEVILTDQGAVGELNGEPAAAVVLATNPGGSGTFYDLAIVMEEDGMPVNVATTSLGDRVQVNSVAIENNQIVVDMVQSGPDDPMCCPTQHVINTYELQGDELVEVSSEEVLTAEKSGEGGTSSESTTATDAQQVERDGIVGVEWHFFEFESGDGSQIFVDDPSRYTLLLNSDGTANVQADCNNGSGSYQLDGSSLTIDIVAVTRALCPPDSLSDDYLRLLGDVVTYVEKDDMLALNLKMDAGNMLFQLEDATADQVHQPTQLVPQDAITLDPGPLATSYHWQVLPPTPYDASMPPVPVGAPPHAVVTFDYLPAPKALMEGGPYIVVYPVDEYVKLWEDAGNETIGNTVSALETLLEEQPAMPAAPMPILPPPGAVNDLAVQTQYLDFASGRGIRFVGRLSQDASPILSTQTAYYFQGLTDDGRFYVSIRWPVRTSALPGSMEEITPDQQQAIESNFETYMQQATESLNTLSSSEWAPDLAELDALISSLTITMPDSE